MKNNKGTVLEKCKIVKQEDGTIKIVEHLKDGDHEVLLSDILDKYTGDKDLNITIRLSETIV
ncbi:hypothetical protein JY742_10070 [Clostridioides difficile]|nr:hypothetical protein [Clostridioides difficile]